MFRLLALICLGCLVRCQTPETTAPHVAMETTVFATPEPAPEDGGRMVVSENRQASIQFGLSLTATPGASKRYRGEPPVERVRTSGSATIERETP